MKIGIDARPLTVQNFTGIPNYTYQICKQWMEKHPEHEYYLMARKPICFRQEELPSNWHILNTPWFVDWGKFWFLFEMPKLIKKHELNVFWGPNYVLPAKVRDVKYFVTIHDMAIFMFKHVGQWQNSLQIRLLLKRNIKKSQKVIAVSQSTKNDVINIMRTKEDEISVVYNGGESADKKVDGEIRPEFQRLNKYLLFIGAIEPRKNINTIISGFESYCVNTDDKDMVLVLAGGRGWNCDDIYEKAKNSKYADRIIMPGFISEIEKQFLLSKATAFVYPSLYEGFGIPILEAYKYGLPVITANNSSLPEVGGNAAYYIDTYDSVGLSDAIAKITSLSVDEKANLQAEMQTKLNEFSWDKCAEETLQIITNS